MRKRRTGWVARSTVNGANSLLPSFFCNFILDVMSDLAFWLTSSPGPLALPPDEPPPSLLCSESPFLSESPLSSASLNNRYSSNLVLILPFQQERYVLRYLFAGTFFSLNVVP